MAAANSVPATPRGQEAMAVFKAVDADSDGSLTLSEMQMKLSDFGVEDNQIEQLFYAMDVNHDGRVSLDEFIAGYRQVLVFRSMDTDGNCEVSLQEAFAGGKGGGCGASKGSDPATTQCAAEEDDAEAIVQGQFEAPQTQEPEPKQGSEPKLEPKLEPEQGPEVEEKAAAALAKTKAAKRKTSAPGAAVAKLQVCVLCAVHGGETEKCECRGPDCPDGQAGGTAYDEDEAAVRDGTGPVHHHRVTCSRSHPRSTHR